MITIIALVMQVLMALITPQHSDVVIIPAMPQVSPSVIEEQEWPEYHTEAMREYEDEFTALFNSYEMRWSKNNRLMIRRGNSGSYKFASKGI